MNRSFLGSAFSFSFLNCRTEKRDECEMIMLIGLPASGKTTWANKHVEENPLKRFNVIGTSVLLERMKVSLIFYRNSLLKLNAY